MTDAIITGLLTFLGVLSGSVVTYFKVRTDSNNTNREADQKDFVAIVDAYKDQVEEYKAEVKRYKDAEESCTKRYHELEKEIQLLKISFSLHKQKNPDLPIPVWHKDNNGMMIALNDEYEREFLLPLEKTREDSIGKSDEHVWGVETASIFQKSDKLAKQQGGVVAVHDLSDAYKHLLSGWNFYKYPIYIGDVIIGVAGFAIRKEIDQPN